MKWWYENEEEEMKVYKDPKMCEKCKAEFFSKPYDHRDATPGQIGYCVHCDNCLIKDKESKMEFDKSRVYTSLNADELKQGDKVIVANCISDLKNFVADEHISKCTNDITKILSEDFEARFVVDNGRTFPFVYLVERAENCTNCENLLSSTEGECSCKISPRFVEYRTKPIDVIRCENYKPKTEQKAEPHHRPFRDTDELIKVWGEKIKDFCDEIPPIVMPLIWVKRKEANSKGQLITEFGDELYVGIGRGEVYNMTDLWVHFTFLDGSVCGVEE